MSEVMTAAFHDELAQIKQAGWFDRISDATAALTRSGSFGKSISGAGAAKAVGKAGKSEVDDIAAAYLKKLQGGAPKSVPVR
jgi:homoserine kinase